MKYIPVILLLISFLACGDVDISEQQFLKYKNEILQLKTESERDTFLAKLFEHDQGIRTNGKEEAVIAKHGFGSDEHRDHSTSFMNEDQEIFHKLRLYLETHGYTRETAFYSNKAKWAFPYITGHHRDYNDQLQILELLMPAYKKELIPLDDIVWIMSEMHEVKYLRLFDVGKERYTLEDEFEGLVNKLKLTRLFEE